MLNYMKCKINIIRKEKWKVNKKRMSVIKMIKLNNQAIFMLYKRYPKMVLSRFFIVIWNALTPYIGIYFSALVIDELAGNRDVERLKMLVMITLVSAAVISLVTALLNKWKETQNAGLWIKVNYLFSEKLLDMDYANLDKTKTAELLSTIRQNQGGTGWGLSRVFMNYEMLCSSVFTLLGGISLTVTLFTCRVPESAGGYTILNNPLKRKDRRPKTQNW